MNVRGGGEEWANVGGNVSPGGGEVEEWVTAGIPERISRVLNEGFGGTPAGEKLRKEATSLGESLELLRGHDAGGQGEEASTGADALDIHTDIAVVKGETKEIAGVADIERLRSPEGLTVRTAGKAYLLRWDTRAARKLPLEKSADERKPRPTRGSLLRLLTGQQGRILRGRRQPGKIVYQIIHQSQIYSTSCTSVSYTANDPRP